MEGFRVIQRELIIGVPGLSNSGLTEPIRVFPAARGLLKWIFPLIYAIFYAVKRKSPVKLHYKKIPG